MKHTLHFISHSHWDREWYMSFEKHRIRLVELIDNLIDTFEKNPDFRSFHLDGQLIVFEDYLEIKPYNREILKKYVSEGRLKIGPAYILQDEFLISGEANVRNLLYGIRMGYEYGPVSMVGYFPDAFGNISQAPQILRGFGIDNAVFGRGIEAKGDDNTFVEGFQPEQYDSELIWRSPDGSTVVGVFFANWYNNASEIPNDVSKARDYISQIRDNAAAVATTPHLLMMNGSDHQPVQVDLPDILKNVQMYFPEDMLLHSSLDAYIDEIKKYGPNLKVVEGELTGQFSDGYSTLINTASSRIYLKQLNHKAQTLLEKWVEPVGVMAWVLGNEYKTDFINKSWKYLLQNHPHDSICGCSIDDVHEEMVVRFKKSIAISEELLDREIRYLTSIIDTSSLDADDIPLVVFNPLCWDVSEEVTATVDFDEIYDITGDGLSLWETTGEVVSADIVEIGRTFTYALPDDSFRRVRYVKRFEVKFHANNVHGMGYKTFILKKSVSDSAGFTYTGNYAENEYIRMEVNENGSLKVINKENGHVFDGLNLFEDCGDNGNEYSFTAPSGNCIITTKSSVPSVSISRRGNSAVTFKISYTLFLPKNCDKQNWTRSSEYKEFYIDSYVTFYARGRRIDILTEFNNNIFDHRFRVLFPTGIKSDYCYADSQFDVVRRVIAPWEGWKNTSNCQRQQTFIDIHDNNNGLVIANKGLPEYEVLDGENTIALTLVRSIGELGDWGDFPTPEAQCQGLQKSEYSIIPYYGEAVKDDAWRLAYQFNVLPLKVVQENIHNGSLGMEDSFIRMNGRNIVLSSLKKCEERDGAILRVYNNSTCDETFEMKFNGRFDKVFVTNINEERQSEAAIIGGRVIVSVPSKKIMTFELIKSKGDM